ncbi:MAG: MBOAT family O-acyltransferase [Gammaproteobacteria bacterium]
MLFNSYIFICGFLPVVLLGFYNLGRHSRHLASLWLAAASLFFYGWWDARFVGLLLGSIAFNYGAGFVIGKHLTGAGQRAKLALIGAIGANLALLGYFKYANFFIENLNGLTGASLPLGPTLLPLGISFFTFTQIAFLADTYQGKVKEYNFVHYTLFVTYFPHLIAGPVLHHKEMMPQFAKADTCKINWNNIAMGLAIFVLGLIKKVFIADTFGEFAAPIFDAVKEGGHPLLFEAWFGALSYTFQLYFDFSAYSDMAIGLSLMFNVILPINFYSPYKALSIIDFWRCWHMTLSRFLRDYLYIPLGGNRHGRFRRHVNLMATMLLGGLWHGAGWTFIAWGGLHGIYLAVNHAWRGFKERMAWNDGGVRSRFGAGVLTFAAVVVGWVFFRSENLASAFDMVRGMFGLNGCSFSKHLAKSAVGGFLHDYGAQFIGTMTLTDISSGRLIRWLLSGLIVSVCFPNVYQLFGQRFPALDAQSMPAAGNGFIETRLIRLAQWRPTALQGLGYGLLFFLVLIHLAFAVDSEFLYFQF